ncbi:MAG: DUF2225 domain-containing protein, partial [bacterium]|nr:DUF2225 domain-containing protein [bacterium]
MLSQYTSALCRTYTITCPACNLDNAFPRLKRDIFRARTSEPDDHPLEVGWRAENVEIPIWVTPLSFFWGVCPNCFYAGQVDNAEFRTWKKNATKFKNQFSEGILDNLAEQANAGQGFAQTVGKAMDPNDVYGTTLIHFFLGIHSEYLKNSPVVGTLARSYLRVAWLYRDQERLFQDFSGSSGIQELLKETGDAWNIAIRSNSDLSVQPQLVTDELSALRQTLAYFELNFSALQSSASEDEMRLMTLIAEIAYRIYELSGIEEDFTKAQSGFSGTMQKCLSVVNDKSIVGGAVNRAKDTLEKAGDRGRELRTLQTKWEKMPPGERLVVATPPPPEPAPPKGSETPETESTPEKPAPPPPVSGDMAELQQKVTKLDE